MLFELLSASYLFPINQRNQNLFTINTYRYWHKIKKEMQNSEEIPPGPVINCYLPGLGKHLIYISPAEKVTDIVCSMDWFRLVQLRLATIFIVFPLNAISKQQKKLLTVK